MSNEIVKFIPKQSAWRCIPQHEEIGKEAILKRLMAEYTWISLTCIYEKLSKHDVGNLARSEVIEARYLKIFQDYVPEEGGLCKSKIRAKLKELSDQGYSHASVSLAKIAHFCGEMRLENDFIGRALEQGALYLSEIPPNNIDIPPPPPVSKRPQQ